MSLLPINDEHEDDGKPDGSNECPSCRGSGFLGDDRCYDCGGEGRLYK